LHLVTVGQLVSLQNSTDGSREALVYVLRQHIESCQEMAAVRRYMMSIEREYKTLLKKRYDLRQIQLPRLQQELTDLNIQIQKFETDSGEDAKGTAVRVKNEILERRKQGLKDYDNDPFQGAVTNFDLGGSSSSDKQQQEQEEAKPTNNNLYNSKNYLYYYLFRIQRVSNIET
jgi:hypothetical protein